MKLLLFDVLLESMVQGWLYGTCALVRIPFARGGMEYVRRVLVYGPPRPYKFLGFGDIHGSKPYKFYRVEYVRRVLVYGPAS